ncbi:MAG: HEPN domain-containing protein [Bacteroidales bacterium]|nr:HEPN domain-containing protein [Bacteroidales bacterium]
MSALLVANKITTKSHNGARQMLNLHCIKTGMFPKSYSRYYSLLFEARQTGDYEDMFDHDEESIGTLQGLAQEIISAVGEKVEQWLAAQSK